MVASPVRADTSNDSVDFGDVDGNEVVVHVVLTLWNVVGGDKGKSKEKAKLWQLLRLLQYTSSITSRNNKDGFCFIFLFFVVIQSLFVSLVICYLLSIYWIVCCLLVQPLPITHFETLLAGDWWLVIGDWCNQSFVQTVCTFLRWRLDWRFSIKTNFLTCF